MRVCESTLKFIALQNKMEMQRKKNHLNISSNVGGKSEHTKCSKREEMKKKTKIIK